MKKTSSPKIYYQYKLMQEHKVDYYLRLKVFEKVCILLKYVIDFAAKSVY